MAQRPNILLVTTDTQRCDTLACMGNPHALSPHLDRLAREGVCFDQAHTASPVCMPARSSLLTGVHTPTHGAIENGIARRTHLTVFPDLLKQQGYTNLMIGKTHFGPLPASFAVQCVVGEKNNTRDDPYSEHLRQYGYTRPDTYPHDVPEGLFMDAFLVDTAIREIGQVVAAGQGPFFAFCSLVSPHEPLDPPDRWGDVYRDRPVPSLNYRPGEVADHPAHLHAVLGLGRRDDQEQPFAGDALDWATIDIPVHVSHESVTEITGPLLDEAAQTCDLTFESYLYPAGCTHLALMLPTALQAGGTAGLRGLLRDPAGRRRVRDAAQAAIDATTATGAYHVIVDTATTGRYVGMRLLGAAAAAGESPGDFAVRLLDEEEPYTLLLYMCGWSPEREAAICRDTVRHPAMLVASDGVYHGPLGHPRGYGCFARVLRRSVRETGAVSLEAAIHKMSGFPATRFRVRDRGLRREGYGADVVIFDPDTVADRSTWDDPWAEPVGIERVLVNGVTVVRGGEPTGALPGRVLR